MLVQHGMDFFRLETAYHSGQKSHELNIKYKLQGEKEIELDGKKYGKYTDHIGVLQVVVIAPDEVYTLINSQEEKRKFLNQTLVQSDGDYIDHLYAYNKLLKQRNAALKLMRKASNLNHELLDALDHLMVPHGLAIYNKRKELVEKLNPGISDYVNKISDHKQNGHIGYESEVDEHYIEALKQSREKDYFTVRTNVGIHRDHVHCKMEDHLLNDIGSQGQIKSFVVAMKLAQFNFLRQQSGSTPLVLLDDIFAKLDATRVGKLLELLQFEHIDQCFITDTHADRVSDLIQKLPGTAYLYKIINGNLNQL